MGFVARPVLIILVSKTFIGLLDPSFVSNRITDTVHIINGNLIIQ